jgi:nucleotide-binding universal stress UspA family protein
MIKDAVVNLTPWEAADPAADFALSLASAFEAHLAGIAFVYDPVIPATMMGGGIPADVIEVQRVEAENAARAAIGRFESAAKRSGILIRTEAVNASAAGAADRFVHIARCYDAAIVAQPNPDSPAADDVILETALFEAGRPVIAVPYIQKQGLTLDRIMVCWDGGRPAARAVADAMPFLARAKAVEIVVVTGERGKRDESAGADIHAHLLRHKISVSLTRIPAERREIADALLSHVVDSGADFMVMGGYGHSRLREFILGGVTRTILRSMTVPTLLSH